MNNPVGGPLTDPTGRRCILHIIYDIAHLSMTRLSSWSEIPYVPPG